MTNSLRADAMHSTNGFGLRPYQSRIVGKAIDMFTGTHRNGAGEIEPPAHSIMIESPTGSGKTVMGLMIAKAMQEQTDARIGWVAMRRNLLDQVRAENERHGIGVDLRTISMFEKNPPTKVDLLVEDEGHHQATSSMAHLHNVIKPKWILGLTATPFRTDSMKLFYERFIRDAGINSLISDGWLSRYDHYTIPRWDTETLADLYCREPERWGKSAFFFQNLNQCAEFHRLMQSRGIVCDVVTGESDRETQLDAFRRGRFQVLANCMVLTEGFDDPSLQTVWVRPSGRGPTIQMAGRALRKHDSTPVKQIVQCRQTKHPFIRTAAARQQFLYHPDGWRSLKVNPKLDLCCRNSCRAIAQTMVELPTFLLNKQDHRRRQRPIRL